MPDALAEALAELLRSGAVESVRVEAVLKPGPASPPPSDPHPPIVFTVGPVRPKG